MSFDTSFSPQRPIGAPAPAARPVVAPDRSNAETTDISLTTEEQVQLDRLAHQMREVASSNRPAANSLRELMEAGSRLVATMMMIQTIKAASMTRLAENWVAKLNDLIAKVPVFTAKDCPTPGASEQEKARWASDMNAKGERLTAHLRAVRESAQDQIKRKQNESGTLEEAMNRIRQTVDFSQYLMSLTNTYLRA